MNEWVEYPAAGDVGLDERNWGGGENSSQVSIAGKWVDVGPMELKREAEKGKWKGIRREDEAERGGQRAEILTALFMARPNRELWPLPRSPYPLAPLS